MANNDRPSYEVGYKKPPSETRFKPGQSGNPKGRPKRVLALFKSLEKELLAVVTLVEEGDKRRKISKLDAILKQHINKAAQGDSKAAALVLSLLKGQPSEEGDRLGVLIGTMREKHARGKVTEEGRNPTKDGDNSTAHDNEN